jgi:hypothetical protein
MALDEQLRQLTEQVPVPPAGDASAIFRRGVRRRRVRQGVSAVAVVAVLGIVGIAVMSMSDGPVLPDIADRPPAPTTPELEEGSPPVDAATAIAQAYIEARNAYDVDRARELVSEGLMTNESPDYYHNYAGMERGFAFSEAYGYEYTDGHCEDPELRSKRVIFVDCDYLWTSELQRITGYGPLPVEFTFRIVDGHIVRITNDRTIEESDVWEPWDVFLREEHPEFFVRLVRDLEGPELLQALEQVPEYFERYGEWVRDAPSGCASGSRC